MCTTDEGKTRPTSTFQMNRSYSSVTGRKHLVNCHSPSLGRVTSSGAEGSTYATMAGVRAAKAVWRHVAPSRACDCCGGAALPTCPAACPVSASQEDAEPSLLRRAPLPVVKTRTLLLCDPYLSLCGGREDGRTGPRPGRCGVVRRGVVCGPEGDALHRDACAHPPALTCSALGTRPACSRLPSSGCTLTMCTVIARFRFPKTLLFVLVPSFYIRHFYNIPKAATAAGKDPLGGRLLTGREVLRCFVFFVSPLFTFCGCT